MTPYEHWQRYTARLHAPKNYLELAWYFMVGTALQRRVWFGKGGEEIFPNQYLLFVAEPGIGKGLATRATKDLLSEVRIDVTPESPKGKQVFSLTSESGSFEKLVSTLVESTRAFSYKASPNDPAPTAYIHASAAIYLDEITSMIHKDAELVVPFLLTVFSGASYSRATHKRGLEEVRNCCLSLFANTQPDKFQDLIKQKVLGTGLLGRFMISYASKNAYDQFFIPEQSPEGEESRLFLIKYLKALSGLFGPVEVDPITRSYLNELWSGYSPKNKSPYLKEYYGRKNIHVTKLAMAIHFSRTLSDYKLTIEDFQEALRILDREENQMHFAFTSAGMNRFAGVASKIVALVTTSARPFGYQELLLEFYSEVNGFDLAAILKDLVDQKKLKTVTVGLEVQYAKT